MVFPMGEAPEEIVLPYGARATRARDVEYTCQGGQQAGAWPMTSNALAVHPSQRREYYEFSVKHGVPTEFDKRGRPVFRTKKHRKRYSELVGASDFDGGYGDPDCR
jgi:hypothetical protein